MRKSILLAICDFLILSALSLSSGVTSQMQQQRQVVNPTGNEQPKSLTPDKTWKTKFKVTDEQIKLLKAQKKINLLSSEQDRIRKEKERVQQELLERTQRIVALKGDNKSILNKNKELLNKVKQDKELIRNIELVVQNLSSQNKNLATNLDEKSSKIKSLSQGNKNLKNLNQQIVQSLNAKKKEIEVLAEKAKTLQATFKDYEQIILTKDKTIVQVKSLMKQIEENNQKLAKDLNMTAKQKTLLEKRKRELETRLVDAQIAVQKEQQNRKRALFAKETALKDTLDKLKQKDSELKKLKDKLKKLSVGNGFVWEKYTASSTKIKVNIVDSSGMKPELRSLVAFAPKLDINGQAAFLTEFSSIGLDWSKILRNKITSFELTVGTDAKNVLEPIKYLTDNPKICFVQSPEKGVKNCVKTIGAALLLKRGLDDIYLFKKNGESSKLKCYFSIIDPGFVFTNSVSSGNTLSAAPGDYLFTKKGQLIGIFVSHSKCYILPNDLSKLHYSTIPINKELGEKYYSKLTEAVKKILKK
jgi:hypothetical protein